MKTLCRISTVLFLVILLLPTPWVRAAGLSDDLLRIHANLLPKTVLMDYNFKQKLVGKTILIDIVCRKSNRYYAQKLQLYIFEKYTNGIGDLPVDVQIIDYADSQQLQKPASLYYFLSAAPEQIQQALKYVPDNRLVFTYDPQSLQYGAHIGLHIGRHIKPVINVDALKADNITLRPALVRISHLYYQDKPSSGLVN
jgi:hypothetical protein